MKQQRKWGFKPRRVSAARSTPNIWIEAAILAELFQALPGLSRLSTEMTQNIVDILKAFQALPGLSRPFDVTCAKRRN